MPRHTPHDVILRTSLSAAEERGAHGPSPSVGRPASDRRPALRQLLIRLAHAVAR